MLHFRFTKFVEGSVPKTILQLDEFLRLRQEVVNDLAKKNKPETAASGEGATATESESAPPGMDAPPGDEAPPGAEDGEKVCRAEFSTLICNINLVNQMVLVDTTLTGKYLKLDRSVGTT